jgi:outer membrane lipoprotein
MRYGEKTMKRVMLSLITILLSACSTLPSTIQAVPEGNLQLSTVNEAEINQYVGEHVRWGGSIVNVENENGRSILEIQHYPLARYGFPLTKNLPTQGRFIAQSNEILDQEIYLEGLLITISGTVTSEISQYVVGNRREDDRDAPHMDIIDIKLWPYNNEGGKAYTYTSSESEFKGYGIYGSGDYKLY